MCCRHTHSAQKVKVYRVSFQGWDFPQGWRFKTLQLVTFTLELKNINLLRWEIVVYFSMAQGHTALNGLRILSNAFRDYILTGIVGPHMDHHWFQTELQRALNQLDDGLPFLFGEFQHPHPHAHLTSPPAMEIFRCCLELLKLISHKIPIHARVERALSQMVSLLRCLQPSLTTGLPNYETVVEAAFERAENDIMMFWWQRQIHPCDYATVRFCFCSWFK